MKKCFKCGEEKEKTEFYKHGRMREGLLGKCKECTKIDVSANYRKNKPHYQKYEKERNQNPERVRAKTKYCRMWRAKNSDAYKAHTAVNNAIRDGRLEKEPCAVCGTEECVIGHHEDYSKPLEVNWMCQQHHIDYHAGIIELPKGD